MRKDGGIDMLKKLTFVFWATCLFPVSLGAQEKTFSLQTPDDLIANGFIKHLLPRFSLKTGIRVGTIGGVGDAAFGDKGVPVFTNGDMIWRLSKTKGPYTDAFEDWLLSDIGKRTIEAFAPNGTSMFSADVSVKEQVKVTTISGDAVLGEEISLQKCGRCHVVHESNRMKAIGSTPVICCWS